MCEAKQFTQAGNFRECKYYSATTLWCKYYELYFDLRHLFYFILQMYKFNYIVAILAMFDVYFLFRVFLRQLGSAVLDILQGGHSMNFFSVLAFLLQKFWKESKSQFERKILLALWLLLPFPSMQHITFL